MPEMASRILFHTMVPLISYLQEEGEYRIVHTVYVWYDRYVRYDRYDSTGLTLFVCGSCFSLAPKVNEDEQRPTLQPMTHG